MEYRSQDTSTSYLLSVTFSPSLSQGTISKSYEIINTDRAALGRVSGTIARQHGDKGFAGSIKLTLQGSGGQSFGCFCIQGLDVKLIGEANDYVGKGMNGGDIAIVPPPNSSFRCVTQSRAPSRCPGFCRTLNK